MAGRRQVIHRSHGGSLYTCGMLSVFRTHLHGRVLIQLVVFAVISVGLFAAVVYDVVSAEVGFLRAALIFLVGIGVGFAAGKIFKLVWHEETRKVIMSLDRMSFVLIAVYIAFRIFGEKLLGHYVQGPALQALTFALLAGILLGRFLSVWQGVRRILVEQGILGR
jgi:hypothetical protein